MRKVVLMLVADPSSRDDVPKLVGLVDQLLAAAFVLCVLAGAILVVLIVAQKMGRRPFGLLIDPGKLGLVAVGAMILGSASGGVLWGSRLYTPAKEAEPQKVQPAYESINDCKPKGQKVADDPGKAKNILGETAYGKLNDRLNGQIENTGSGPSKVYKDAFLDFKPSKDDDSCGDKPASCYKIKVTYMRYEGAAIGSNWKETSGWVEPDGADKDSCGGDLQQF